MSLASCQCVAAGFQPAKLGGASCSTIVSSAWSRSEAKTAGVAADGSLAVAYLPKAQELTIDLSKLNGPVRANWFDPTDGSSKAIEGAPFANGGRRQMAPPEKNAAGDHDWVLILQAVQGTTVNR